MTDDNMVAKMRVNNLIEGVLEEHVAATRSQRVEIRNLLLDAIEQAGFDIVGKDQPAPQSGVTSTRRLSPPRVGMYKGLSMGDLDRHANNVNAIGRATGQTDLMNEHIAAINSARQPFGDYVEPKWPDEE